MTTEAAPKSLVTKLAEVMAEVERVAKRGRNDFHKYDYVTEADIAAAVREHMAKRHLMMVPNVESMTWRDGKNREGSPIATLGVKFTVYDGDTGETLSFNIFGEGQDSGDKATYKAMTGANKYALLKLFQIPTGDDPEREEKSKRQNPPHYDRSEAAQNQRRENSLADAPYKDRETAPPPPQEPQDTYQMLMERRGFLPKDVQHMIPLDEALLKMAPEEEDQREKYVSELRAKVDDLKLNAGEKGELMWTFFGNRRARLDTKGLNIWFLKAMHKHVVTPA